MLCEMSMSSKRMTNTARSLLYEVLKIVKLIGWESRIRVSRGRRKENRELVINGQQFSIILDV